MLEKLKQDVFEANMELQSKGVVIYTWGNVSGIDREKNLVIIKPSGVDYDRMKADDMVVVDLISGERVSGSLKPSSDAPTHLELYRRFPTIGGIVHTHSKFATAFAQAGIPLNALGTTHADYFYGDVPCTRDLTIDEVQRNYELNTGKVIAETIDAADPLSVPAVLVKNHGPFSWGTDPKQAVYHAVVLECVAEMAFLTFSLTSNCSGMPRYILDKHYSRKHGANAYYGQC